MKKFLAGFFLVIAVFLGHLSADDTPKAVIIFDASGSMWGQINGKAKIEIARDALKNVVREWNPSVELGLTVYGHRSKGDCNDIETVIPVGKINRNNVIRTVMGIKPKGKTPISRSLRKVADEIKYTEEKATIILISDGKETCDPDPCGTAKELEKEGIDFVTHVIGFNVDKKTDKQLECIANATGGEYFSAKNAAALNKAMKVIAKKVEVVVPPKPKVKKLDHTLETSASEKEGGKWIAAYHTIYQDEEGKPGDRVSTAHSQKKRAGKAQIPVGKYILKSTYNDFEKETAFEVKPGELTKIHVVMGQTGTVEISTSEIDNGKWVKASGSLYKEDGDRTDGFRTGKDKPATYQLPAGKYYVKMSYNSIEKQVPFEVKPGEVTKLHVVMGQTGVVESSASEKEGGKWIHAGGYVYPLNDDGSKGEWITQIITSKNRLDSDRLPIGKYVAELEYNNFKKDVIFEITAGKTLKLHVLFRQFIIGAKCSDINAKVSYEVYANNGRLIEEKQIKCSDTLKMTLDDGDYRVEAKVGEGTGEAKFTVGSGKVNKLILDLSNLNHEEEIKADSETAVVVPVHPKKREVTAESNVKSEEISIGGKEIEIKGMSKDEAKQLKNLGAMLGALGGMMQGVNSKEQKEKQNAANTAADAEFDEMSKDLDMFTK